MNTNATRFPLGRLLATPGALRLLQGVGADPFALLDRHAAGDWGDVPPEDADENELSVRQGYRVMSSYLVGEDGAGEALGRVWIITEADRFSTCILLPEQY